MEGERVVPMRLQKFLARAGAASRRGSEDLMTAGRVAVNGVVATELGTKVDPLVDEVTLDGMPVSIADEPVYIAFNKPAGVVTTMSDPQGRPTVATFVPVKEHPGLFPVGRLDYDTTGLLLFTTDGEIAHRLLHPSRHVEKVYRALIDGRADGGRTRPPTRRYRARRRAHGAGASEEPALVGYHDVRRDRYPRGPQAPGPAHVLQDSSPRAGATPRDFRPDQCRRSEPGRLAPSHH